MEALDRVRPKKPDWKDGDGLNEVMIVVLPVIGTVLGSMFGVLASNRLTNHRLLELEKKVDKHNEVITRTFILEEKVKVLNHRIEDLEKKP